MYQWVCLLTLRPVAALRCRREALCQGPAWSLPRRHLLVRQESCRGMQPQGQQHSHPALHWLPTCRAPFSFLACRLVRRERALALRLQLCLHHTHMGVGCAGRVVLCRAVWGLGGLSWCIAGWLLLYCSSQPGHTQLGVCAAAPSAPLAA